MTKLENEKITEKVTVDLEFTPNPNTLKYVVNRTLLESGAENFKNKEAASGISEIAEALFAIKGIEAVMVGKSFVTVTLGDQDSLTELNDTIISTLQNFIESGKPPVNLEAISKRRSQISTAASGSVEARIQEILDNDIRPAVAMDGGDITFDRFQDGTVYLQMKGSCSGCPSSTATLKMGIENRLKDAIPEVVEVVAV